MYKYSPEGDIQTLIGSVPKPGILRKKYPTNKQLVSRLYELLIYKNGNIKWNKLLSISIFCSYFLVYYLSDVVTIPKIMVTSCLLFLVLDLPYRFEHTHLHTGISHEASMLYALIDKD